MLYFTKTNIAPAIRRHTTTPVIYGLEHDTAKNAKGSDFLYVDHSYFRRHWDEEFFRLVRGNVHLTRVIPNKADRLRRMGVELKPWRKKGRRVVVIDPSKYLTSFYGLSDDIAYRMADEVRQYTDRDVYVKTSKKGLPEALDEAWAVVCPVSVAGVEAAVAGVPVFSLPHCPSYPISAGELKDIEKPEYKDRYDWVNSLCWSCWNWTEISLIKYKDYQCE